MRLDRGSVTAELAVLLPVVVVLLGLVLSTLPAQFHRANLIQAAAAAARAEAMHQSDSEIEALVEQIVADGKVQLWGSGKVVCAKVSSNGISETICTRASGL